MEEQHEAMSPRPGIKRLSTGLDCDCLHIEHAVKGVHGFRARNVECTYRAGSCTSSSTEKAG